MILENTSRNRWVGLRSFGDVLWQRAKTKGALWVAGKIVEKTLVNVLWFLLLPLSFALHVIGFRRLTVFPDRIGHLAAEVDCFLKIREMGQLSSGRFWFMLAPLIRVSNSHLLDYWRRHVTVVSNPILCWTLNVLSMRGPMVHSVADYILAYRGAARYYEVNAEWGLRPPLLKLTDDDQYFQKVLMAKLGLPSDAWFVCFHVREGGYSPLDEVIQSHRNANIENYFDAMRLIVQNGGWCIRVGDPSMKPLPQMQGVIDYAHHPVRSQRADLILSASCRFFVGTSSGLFILASIFGVACALANMVPASTLGYARGDISIPKRLRRSADRREISLPQQFESSISGFRVASQYHNAGIEVVENTAEEIFELVNEMLKGSEGNCHITDDDEQLQARFRALFRENHYGYRASGRIGKSFLRQHRGLL